MLHTIHMHIHMRVVNVYVNTAISSGHIEIVIINRVISYAHIYVNFFFAQETDN